MSRPRHGLLAAAAVLLALTSLAAAETARRGKKTEPAAPAATPADKRDRLVTAPGTPFNGRSYWQAAAQCGGLYYKLGTVYSDSAARAKVKPDAAAYAQFTKDADNASKTASAFFVVAERFLIADRKLARDDAVMTFDAVASSNGDRVKTAEAAIQAAQPCAEFYKSCRGTFPQLCNDPTVLAN